MSHWVQAGQVVALRRYRHFAQSIEQGRDAVQAALDLPWSSGKTDGQFHRLKLLKRQKMAGLTWICDAFV